MSDFDDPKIIRLPVRSAPNALPFSDEIGDALREVEEILSEAESIPTPPSAEQKVQVLPVPSPTPLTATPEIHGPPPHHPNAIVCPQCQQWTWRYTDECRYCGFNIAWELDRQQAEQHRRWLARRRLQLSHWAFGLMAGGIAANYLGLNMPNALGTAMVTGGWIAMLAAFMCVKVIEKN